MMLLVCLFLLWAAPVQAQPPIEVKVVVVTMFERGADTGDQPGEFQYWVEREGLDRVFPFPQGWRDLRMNQDGVLALCTGIGTAKAAASVMALGLDPALRPAQGLLGGGRHCRDRPGGWLARVGGVGGMGRRRRPRPRDRRARDSAGVADRLHPAPQDDAL